jgi:Uma2 family endonuclease
MATTTSPVSVEDYFKISTDPDCELADGVLVERTVGEFDHSTWQMVLAGFFLAREKELGILSRPELRVQTRSKNFRVPDVTLISRSAPREQILTHPPLAVFEILSPQDSMTQTLQKLAEYEQMGIGAIWVIEPKEPLYFRYSEGKLAPETIFELPGSTFKVAFAEIAALID